jgi:hypothetical protein
MAKRTNLRAEPGAEVRPGETLHVRIMEPEVVAFLNKFAAEEVPGVKLSPAVALRIIATRVANGLPVITPRR